MDTVRVWMSAPAIVAGTLRRCLKHGGSCKTARFAGYQ